MISKAKKKLFKAKIKARKKLAQKEINSSFIKRSTEAAEKNVHLRMWQLVVAIIAALFMMVGIMWQILRT